MSCQARNQCKLFFIVYSGILVIKQLPYSLMMWINVINKQNEIKTMVIMTIVPVQLYLYKYTNKIKTNVIKTRNLNCLNCIDPHNQRIA